MHSREKPSKRYTYRVVKIAYKSSLISHHILNTDEKRFECDICHEKFSRKWYIEHLLKTYECDICQKLIRECQLELHLKTHSGGESFECDTCQKKFVSKSNLKRHFKLHARGSTFECDTCEKKFTYEANLIRHQTLHTGENPFECDICQKKYVYKKSFIAHQEVHTGKKTFEFVICSENFKLDGDLTAHKMMHTTGERKLEGNKESSESFLCEEKIFVGTDHSSNHSGIQAETGSIKDEVEFGVEVDDLHRSGLVENELKIEYNELELDTYKYFSKIEEIDCDSL